MISDFQRKKLKYLFSLYDLNGNGYLQLEDFTNIADLLCDKLEYKPASKHHERLSIKTVQLFHRLLRDIRHENEQVISLNEWVQFFDEQVIGPEDEELLTEYGELIIGFVFDLFDENHDGYISFEEYNYVFDIYGIDRQFAEKAYYNLDLNSDKRLSRYELIHAVEVFLKSDDPTMPGNWIFGNWDAAVSRG